jgi:hypothetical protein
VFQWRAARWTVSTIVHAVTRRARGLTTAGFFAFFCFFGAGLVVGFRIGFLVRPGFLAGDVVTRRRRGCRGRGRRLGPVTAGTVTVTAGRRAA